ncbi:MAG: hypothetical protein QMD73_13240 [Rhodocyclaceae bacterium]|nr:hypothetical protein [Rhodocyclaceae bacterium]
MTIKTTIATHDAGRCPAPRRLTTGQLQLVHCDCCRKSAVIDTDVCWCREYQQFRSSTLERRCESFEE